MKNLIAEMARYGVRIIDIQSLLKCSERTVRNKLNNERDFTIPEALKIRNTYQPHTETCPECRKKWGK